MRSAIFVCVALALPAFSQPKYASKLAPYVASPVRVVDLMLDIAKVKPGETVIDLGSGDGRILIAAVERFKAKAIGVEISPKLVAQARQRIQREGITDMARVIEGDVMQADLSGADVVTMYLESKTNADLRPRLEKMLKPGARVVSHDYAIPGWKPTRVEKLDGRQGHMIYLYEIPPAKQ
jgi:cyclopropane fatty-acyl-phospholipid synthase-like methyltransferase